MAVSSIYYYYDYLSTYYVGQPQSNGKWRESREKSLSLPTFVFLGQVNTTEPSFLTSLKVGENAVLLT